MDEVLRLEEWGARDNSDCNYGNIFFCKIKFCLCREANCSFDILRFLCLLIKQGSEFTDF